MRQKKKKKKRKGKKKKQQLGFELVAKKNIILPGQRSSRIPLRHRCILPREFLLVRMDENSSDFKGIRHIICVFLPAERTRFQPLDEFKKFKKLSGDH